MGCEAWNFPTRQGISVTAFSRYHYTTTLDEEREEASHSKTCLGLRVHIPEMFKDNTRYYDSLDQTQNAIKKYGDVSYNSSIILHSEGTEYCDVCSNLSSLLTF